MIEKKPLTLFDSWLNGMAALLAADWNEPSKLIATYKDMGADMHRYFRLRDQYMRRISELGQWTEMLVKEEDAA